MAHGAADHCLQVSSAIRPPHRSRRFLAERFGLMGSTPFESATIDMVTEHVRDVKDAQRAKRFSAFVKDKDEEQKAQDKEEWFSQDLCADESRTRRRQSQHLF